MRIGIGVSTGTEVVCAALVIEEDDGSRTVEYRTVSTDSEVNTDTGDLVESAIELMASLAPVKPGASAHAGERRLPDAIAVSHRTREQATSIRSALARSRWSVSLVPEHAAAYAFLDEAGLIARYRSVLIVDVGAAGTTASVVDTGSGDLLAQDRTAHLSGDVVNRLVKDLVHGSPAPDDAMRDDLRDDRGTGSARYRAVKEHLSTHDSAEVSWPGGASNLDRAAFDTVVRPYVANMAHFTERTAATAEISPEAVVLIGGGANIPIVGTQFEEILAAPVLTPSEPDTILAKGSAHLALNGRTGGYVIAGPGAVNSTRSIGRFSGALVGALVVGGIVVAYGVQTLVPDDRSSVSPAGSAAPTEGQADLPIADGGSVTDTGVRTTAAPDRSAGSAPSYGQPAVTPIDTLPAVTAVPSTTPSLHPAPDLPVIPFPASPQPSREVATVAPRPVTTNPVTTTPVVTPPTDVSTEVPPTESPGESTTPEPTQGGSTELSPPPATPAVDIPTTDVNATTSPGLSPPESVWTPPPLLSAGPRETPRAEPATTTAVTPEG